MALHVIDAEKGLAKAPRQRFAEGEPDHQCPDEARAASRRYRVDLIRVDTCLRHRLVHQRADRLHMGSGGDLGNDATESRVNVGLRCKHRRSHLETLNDGDPGLVTAGLDSKDEWVAHAASPNSNRIPSSRS